MSAIVATVALVLVAGGLLVIYVAGVVDDLQRWWSGRPSAGEERSRDYWGI